MSALRTVLALLSVPLFAGLVGCNSGIAQQRSAADDFSDTLCPSGCIYQESPGKYLALRLGPMPLQAGSFSYVLPYDMELQAMDSWIGSGDGVPLETEARLRLKLPDGSWYEFLNELDKHQDVRGEKQRYFSIRLRLPAGTKITFYHRPGYNPNQYAGNAIDAIWYFYAAH